MKKTTSIIVIIAAVGVVLSAIAGMLLLRGTARTAESAITFAVETFCTMTTSWDGAFVHALGTTSLHRGRSADAFSQDLRQLRSMLGERRSYKMTAWNIEAHTSTGITAKVSIDAEFEKRDATFTFVLRRDDGGDWQIDDLQAELGSPVRID